MIVVDEVSDLTFAWKRIHPDTKFEEVYTSSITLLPRFVHTKNYKAHFTQAFPIFEGHQRPAL